MYTEATLRAEIAKIYRNPSEQFIWEEKASTPTLDDFVAYCWTAYEKARSATGAQVIGRVTDIHQTIRTKVANLLQGETLFKGDSRGNILQMDKWCLVMNDCWILGGVHRGADFLLMSDTVWKNVWNPSLMSFVVTAREIIGLQTFGYARGVGTKLTPGSQAVATYASRNAAKAAAADLEDYHLAVALRETRGALGARDLIT